MVFAYIAGLNDLDAWFNGQMTL